MSTETPSCFGSELGTNKCMYLQDWVNVINWTPTTSDPLWACVGIISLISNIKKQRLSVDMIYPGFTVRGNSGSFKPKSLYCPSSCSFYFKILPSVFPKLQPLLVLGGSLRNPRSPSPMASLQALPKGIFFAPFLSKIMSRSARLKAAFSSSR